MHIRPGMGGWENSDVLQNSHAPHVARVCSMSDVCVVTAVDVGCGHCSCGRAGVGGEEASWNACRNALATAVAIAFVRCDFMSP